jgi:hypothetical protein
MQSLAICHLSNFMVKLLIITRRSAKVNAKTQMAALLVMDLSFKNLGRHLDFGIRLAGHSGMSTCSMPEQV